MLVIEGVEKPGNLGAILRTADAAGLSAVIVCDPQADLYNPNVVRASLGCVFTVPLAVCSSKEAVGWLKKNGFQILTTHLHSGAVLYDSVDFKKKTAVAMGTEATGLGPIWLENTHQNILIPMKGEADSLNVSTSAAIIVYEACRQRGFR